MNLEKIFGALVLGFFAFQGPAGAELMLGSIERIYDHDNAIALKRFNPQRGTIERVKISVSLSTELEGIVSTTDFKAGDKVVVEAERDKRTGRWDAVFIDLAETYKAE